MPFKPFSLASPRGRHVKCESQTPGLWPFRPDMQEVQLKCTDVFSSRNFCEVVMDTVRSWSSSREAISCRTSSTKAREENNNETRIKASQ